MTRDEIIELATDAGLYSGNPRSPGTEHLLVYRLQRFAALVAAAERKECAALCDRFQARDVGMQPAECAAAIRAMNDGLQQYAAAACRDEIDRSRGTIDIVSAALFAAEKELAELRPIKAAAMNLAKVKGRHNSEIAMNQLLEALR